ncbi:hypothetical protein JD969_16175 [Planctomycetota bacterium]|nr:hypothetical protein JD969_16175 [Planctomycetota bacterium]
MTQPDQPISSRFDSHSELWELWYHAASDPKISTEIVNFYNELSEEIRNIGATCLASGRCCKFETFGHRLYVTGLEIAWVLHQLIMRPKKQTDLYFPQDKTDDTDPSIHLNVLNTAAKSLNKDGSPIDGCVYQIDNLCTIHEIRPLGCRIFFCDPSNQKWQNDLYEKYLNKLRDIHTKYDIPYRYMEWRTSLEEASKKISA